MEDAASNRILGKIGFAILVIALVDLGFLNYWVVKNDKLATSIQALAQRQVAKPADSTAEAKVDEGAEDAEEASPLPTPAVTLAGSEKETTTASAKQSETVVQTAQKEIFVPLGSGSTKSSTYVALGGLEVTIDPAKYSAIESIVFEASIWVEGGNGRAWGQLYVVEDKVLLVESQISNPTDTGVLKTSGKIPVPGAAKTYRVWAKTELGDYTARVENARLKITLK